MSINRHITGDDEMASGRTRNAQAFGRVVKVAEQLKAQNKGKLRLVACAVGVGAAVCCLDMPRATNRVSAVLFALLLNC